MRIALIGGGTIARLVLEHVRDAVPGRFQPVALMGRPGGAPRAAELAREFSVKYVETREALAAAGPQAVIEAASHEAVRQHLVPLLEDAISPALRRTFAELLEMTWLFQMPAALPTSLPELGFGDQLTRRRLCETFERSMDYWARSKGLRAAEVADVIDEELAS